MTVRKLILGEYDTALHGFWTMNSCKITKAQQIQSFIDIPGRYAPLDASTALTDGQPYYGSAHLLAGFESSEGDLAARQNRIDAMRNYLDGRNVQIIHPDHPDQYLVGRVQVDQEFNDLVHCAVTVSAVCEPWFYAAEPTVHTVALTDEPQYARLTSAGRMAVTPTVHVDGDVRLVCGDNSWELTSGEYAIPDLSLFPSDSFGQLGGLTVTCSGVGSVTFSYREAVLAG